MNRPREEGSMGGASRNDVNYGEARPALTTNDALLYLREVKQRFQHRKEVYDTFLDIMKDFKSQSIEIGTVISKVKTLLRGHEDLILGFNTFLPKGSEITMEDLHREENPPPAPQIRPAVELDQAIAYINRIKNRFADDPRVYKNFLEILCCFRQGRMDITDVYRDVADLFQHHEDLLEEFQYFLPDRTDEGGSYPLDFFPSNRSMAPLSPSTDAYGPLRRRRSDRKFRDFDLDLAVFDDIKTRLNNPGAYSDLLKCVNLFAQDVISKTDLVGLGSDVLGKYPDVMARFREFVASIPGEDETETRGRESYRGSFHHYQRSRALQQRNKYTTLPVSELDTSDLQRPTTSYILLPQDYPQMPCSGKTALGREVLQDMVASVTTGTEDGSFKHSRKNQYEEALFRAEDERYDAELILERTRSMIKALIPVQETIDSMSVDAKTTFRLPANTLRAFHVRTIEKIYGDKGNSVCELLRNHPVVSVPVVLFRLQQKLEEWINVLKIMDSHWQLTADTNYHKSLDHRSFYFKQQDKKTLAPKTLLQELKDEAEPAKSAQRLTSLSAGVPVESLFVPHLEFQYDDPGVHEDVYNIIRFAASKIMTPEIRKQGMEIWTKFLEPFLHIAPHSADEDMMDIDSGDAEGKSIKYSPPAPLPFARGPREDFDTKDSALHERKDVEAGEIKPEAALSAERELSSPSSPPDRSAAADVRAEIVQEDVKMADQTEEASVSNSHEGGRDTSEDWAKPISTSLHQGTPTSTPPTDMDPAKSRPGSLEVFFCNEAFYLFFRYHEILYSRIKLARKCCRELNPGPSDDQSDGKPPVRSPYWRIFGPGVMNVDSENTEKRHSQFMSLVYALSDGSIDIAQFEDQCRSLLSTNSYVLFTLDKLIRSVVKQLQTLVVDENSKLVWDLYKYESSRETECNQAVYYANAKTVVREEYVVRVCSKQGGSISFTHLDNSFVYDIPSISPKFIHEDYFEAFMESTDRGLPDNPAVFLNRNKEVVQMQCYDPTGGDEDKRMEDAMELGLSTNGLEMKVSGEDCKVKFVEGTSDIWLTKPTGTASNDKQKRRAILQRWVDSHLSNTEFLPQTVEQFMSVMQERL